MAAAIFDEPCERYKQRDERLGRSKRHPIGKHRQGRDSQAREESVKGVDAERPRRDVEIVEATWSVNILLRHSASTDNGIENTCRSQELHCGMHNQSRSTLGLKIQDEE